MDYERQADSIRRLPRAGQTFGFVLASLGEVVCAANLDAADHVAMLGDDSFDVLNVAISQVVKLTQRGECADAADHPLPRDVQQREDSRGGRIDHELPKAVEDQSARRSEIDDSRHTTSETCWIGIDSEVTHTGKDVNVKVDQAGHDVATLDIDGPSRRGRRTRFQDRGNSSTGHRDLARSVQFHGGINHMALANQQVIHGGCLVFRELCHWYR